MEFNEIFVEKLEKEIEKNLKDDNILQDEKRVSHLANLTTIYQNICSTKATELQTQFMKQSAESMKNIDFSKLDIKEMLGKFMGK